MPQGQAGTLSQDELTAALDALLFPYIDAYHLGVDVGDAEFDGCVNSSEVSAVLAGRVSRLLK